MAAAAAISGETRWVLPPGPWRPSKLRLEVEAHRSPDERMSGFIPRHIEHPASRQSKPASLNTASRPLRLGLMLHRGRARHDHRVDRLADLAATYDLSSGTEVVRGARSCRSRGKRGRSVCPRRACPGSRAMYSNARSAATRSSASSKGVRIGNTSGHRNHHAGVRAPRHHRFERTCVDLDQLIELRSVVGPQLRPSVDGDLEIVPLRSVGTASQVLEGRLVRERSSPLSRRPRWTYCRRSCVRPWISERTVSPVYSTTCPCPPPIPICPMMPRMRSFAVTPNGSAPLTLISIVGDSFCRIVCVARTCSTSDVPIPKARAPKAPCVDVWLSPQTMTLPGWVHPCSGPMMWTMPWFGLAMSNRLMPNSSQLRLRASSCCFAMGSLIGRVTRPGSVGGLWSTTATERSVRRTPLPASRSPFERLRRRHLVDQDAGRRTGPPAAPLPGAPRASPKSSRTSFWFMSLLTEGSWFSIAYDIFDAGCMGGSDRQAPPAPEESALVFDGAGPLVVDGQDAPVG